jgi:hypothetical protein
MYKKYNTEPVSPLKPKVEEIKGRKQKKKGHNKQK